VSGAGGLANFVVTLKSAGAVFQLSNATLSGLVAASSTLTPAQILDFGVQTAASISGLAQNVDPAQTPLTVVVSLLGVATGATVLSQDQAATQADAVFFPSNVTHDINVEQSELFTMLGDMVAAVGGVLDIGAATAEPLGQFGLAAGLRAASWVSTYFGIRCNIWSAKFLIGDATTVADIEALFNTQSQLAVNALGAYQQDLSSQYGPPIATFISDLTKATTAIANTFNANVSNFGSLIQTASNALLLANSDLLNVIGLSGIAPTSVTVNNGAATTITNGDGSISETGNINPGTDNTSAGAGCTITRLDPYTVTYNYSLSPSDEEVDSATAQAGSDSISQSTTSAVPGSVTSQTTTFDGVSFVTPTSDPAFINIGANEALQIVDPFPTDGDEISLEGGSGGSYQLLVDPNTGSPQQAIDFGTDGLTGDTISLADMSNGTIDVTTDIGNGDTAVVSSDDALSDVPLDFSFAGTSGVLAIENSASFAGTISNFTDGDTLDLAGVAGITGAALGANNVLTVREVGGGSVSLNLDPTQDFSGESFLIGTDGVGGSDIMAVSDMGNVTLSASANLLVVVNPADFNGPGNLITPSGRIFNFALGDTIDLPNIGAVQNLQLNSFYLYNNDYRSIQFTDASSASSANYFSMIDLPVDSGSKLEGLYLQSSPDGAGGTDITATQGPTSTSLTFYGSLLDGSGGYIGKLDITISYDPTQRNLNVTTEDNSIETEFSATSLVETLEGYGSISTTLTSSPYRGVDGNILITQVPGGQTAQYPNGYSHVEMSPGVVNPPGGSSGGNFYQIFDPVPLDTSIYNLPQVLADNPSSRSVAQSQPFPVLFAGNAFPGHSGPLSFVYQGMSATCYVEGTRIATLCGEVVVERLVIGDIARSSYPDYSSIKWIGHRHIDCRRHQEPRKVWPVRVSADAFGENLPHRDLWLSPDHAVYVDDVLIPIKHLINGTSIQQVPRDEVTYYHVELEQHDVLLAEGLPCESYLDTGDRSKFSNGGGVVALHPDFSARMWETKGCAPLVVTGPTLNAVRQRLNSFAPAARACA
jgi:hypothetical protein